MNLNVEVCSKIWNRIDIDEVAVQDLLLHVRASQLTVATFLPWSIFKALFSFDHPGYRDCDAYRSWTLNVTVASFRDPDTRGHEIGFHRR